MPSRTLFSRPTVRAGVILICVMLLHVYFITAGTFDGWPTYTALYSKLSAGFLHHQLNLITRPLPKLLALADPYDPRASQFYRLHDAVLFEGKYYLYWGPVPAMIAAAFFAAMGNFSPDFGDQYLVFIFLFGTVICSTILIYQIRRRFFPAQSPATTDMAILSLAMGTPALFTLTRAAAYEAAICAGQFFLVAGILLAWLGLRDGKAKLIRLTLAGLCLAMSVGSRASLAPAVAAIALLTLLRIRRNTGPALGFLLPLIAGAVLLAAYNQARFHSFTEFGLRYQLAARNQFSKPMSQYASARYIPVNLYRYLVAAPVFGKEFPYIFAASGMPRMAEYFDLPGSFGFESVVGVIWCQPFLLLAPVAACAPWWRRFGPAREKIPDRSLLIWVTLTLTIAAALGFAPAVTVEGSTMRYLMDMVPCATILAAMGFWWMQTLKPSRWFYAAAVTIVLFQMALAIPLAVTGYYSHFATFNPALYNLLH